MSVLRGPDGKFYDVPDDQLTKYAVPPEKVRETLERAGVPAPAGRPEHGPGGGGGPPGMGMHGGPVVIQIYPPPPMGGPGPGPGHEGGSGEPGQVDPYWYYWWTRYWTRYYYW
jgi:hypothetical protein